MQIPALLLLACLLHAQDSTAARVVEPEVIGSIYFRDEAGKLSPLEAAKARRYYDENEGVKDQLLLKGGKSKVRLQPGQKVLFVVRLPNGSDPGAFSLLALKKVGGARRFKTDPGDKRIRLALALNITKFGESSYGLTPAVDLIPGEYGFVSSHSKIVYCFGVGEGKHGKNG